jgi:hypothetical protein
LVGTLKFFQEDRCFLSIKCGVSLLFHRISARRREALDAGVLNNADERRVNRPELLENNNSAHHSERSRQLSPKSVASFEHHTSPHGLPHPHIHNVVIPAPTAAARE